MTKYKDCTIDELKRLSDYYISLISLYKTELKQMHESLEKIRYMIEMKSALL